MANGRATTSLRPRFGIQIFWSKGLTARQTRAQPYGRSAAPAPGWARGMVRFAPGAGAARGCLTSELLTRGRPIAGVCRASGGREAWPAICRTKPNSAEDVGLPNKANAAEQTHRCRAKPALPSKAKAAEQSQS